MDELDLSSSTLASFKSVIFNYYKSALAVSYDCEDPRSFSSLVTSNNFLYVAVVFLVSLCFLIFLVFFFISIRARCNWPQLLRSPCQRSFCLSVCLFVSFF